MLSQAKDVQFIVIDITYCDKHTSALEPTSAASKECNSEEYATQYNEEPISTDQSILRYQSLVAYF